MGASTSRTSAQRSVTVGWRTAPEQKRVLLLALAPAATPSRGPLPDKKGVFRGPPDAVAALRRRLEGGVKDAVVAALEDALCNAPRTPLLLGARSAPVAPRGLALWASETARPRRRDQLLSTCPAATAGTSTRRAPATNRAGIATTNVLPFPSTLTPTAMSPPSRCASCRATESPSPLLPSR